MTAWLQQLLELLRNLNRLRPHLRPNRWLVFSAVGAATVSALFEMVGIGLLVPLLGMMQGNANQLFQGRYLRFLPELFPNHSSSFYVGIFAGFVLSAIVAKNIVSVLYTRLMAHFSRRISVNLRDSLFRRLQHASLHVFEERRSGELLNAYTTEAIRTQSAVEFLLLLAQRGFLAMFYLLFIVYISWQFMLALLGLMLVLGGFTMLFQSRLASRGNQRSAVQRELFGYIGGIFAGVRVVRATHAEAQTLGEFSRINRQLGDVEVKGSFLSSLIGPITETVAVAGAMVLIVLAQLWLIDSGKLGINKLMVIGFVLIRLLPLVNQIYGVLGQLAYLGGGVREALRWLETPQFPSRPFGSQPFAGLRHGIRLEHLSFVYPNGTKALDDLNLDIPAGKTVALVGTSGSGKTTLASLLLRLREPTGGRLLVDGTDYWEFSAESWHARLGMVEQEAFLFNDTVRNNIAVGCPDPTPERLQRALRTAHLEDVVAKLPHGLDSMVGERGTMLSGGQKQRLAIARAMIREPLLLILDEATSALDNVSERQVQAALDEARQGRTSVVIAHRLTTIRNADLIVVMEHGRIVETGTWAELERRGGSFQRLLEATRATKTEPDSSPILPAVNGA